MRRVKNENKPTCSKCGKRDRVKKNGTQDAPRTLGKRQRFYCKRCKRSWEAKPNPAYEALRPLHALRDKDIKGIAMYLVGLEFEAVEGFAEVKQTTLRAKLMAVFCANLWSEMEEIIMGRFTFLDRRQFMPLFMLCSEAERDKGAFSRAGYLRAKAWREMSEDAKEALFDKASTISAS
jgi:transposase-like protein